MNSQTYNAGSLFEVYYDVSPDTLLDYTVAPYTNETLGFNLFDDGSEDIQIAAHGSVSSSGSSAYISITSFNLNVSFLFGRWDSVYVPASSGWDVTKIAKPLIVTEPIDAPAAVWDNTTLYLTDHSGHGGGIKNVNDWIGMEKFIGFRYDNNGNYSYGWIRIKCQSKDSCYVKDLSYSQVSIGIEESLESPVQLFPNPSKNSFYLKNIDLSSFNEARLILTNANGQNIKFTYEAKGLDIKINTEENLAAGCYILKYGTDKKMLSKKLIKSSD